MNARIAAPIRKQASMLFLLVFFFPRSAGFLINYQLDEKETKNQDKTKLLRANPANPPKADKHLAFFSGQRALGKFGGMQFSPLCGIGCFPMLWGQVHLTLAIGKEGVRSVEKKFLHTTCAKYQSPNRPIKNLPKNRTDCLVVLIFRFA